MGGLFRSFSTCDIGGEEIAQIDFYNSDGFLAAGDHDFFKQIDPLAGDAEFFGESADLFFQNGLFGPEFGEAGDQFEGFVEPGGGFEQIEAGVGHCERVQMRYGHSRNIIFGQFELGGSGERFRSAGGFGKEGNPGSGLFSEGVRFFAILGQGMFDVLDFHLKLLFFELEHGQVSLVAPEGIPLILQFDFCFLDLRHGASGRFAWPELFHHLGWNSRFHRIKAIGQNFPSEVECLFEGDVHREIHHFGFEQAAVLQQFAVPCAEAEAHGLFFEGFAEGRVKLDHRVHDGSVIFTGLAVYELFESAEGTEGFDAAAAKVELAFRDVAGVVRDGVCHVVARHGGDGKDGDRAGRVEIHGLFISRG